MDCPGVGRVAAQPIKAIPSTDNHGVLNVDPGKWEQFIQNLIYFLCPPNLIGLNVGFFLFCFVLFGGGSNFIALLNTSTNRQIISCNHYTFIQALFLESNKIVFFI